MEGAAPGKTVYVNDDLVIDFTNENITTINIPAGVTLASGRGNGNSQGAIIKTNSFSNTSSGMLFNVLDGIDNVRITGIRIFGPEMDIQDYDSYNYYDPLYIYPNITGIRSASTNLTVDNCEIAGWPHCAIWLTRYDLNISNSEVYGYIHHNYIHNNRRLGVGYGIAIGSGNKNDIVKKHALIKANIFDYNRHDIAGSGQIGLSYEACYNYILNHYNIIDHHNYHNFDAHGLPFIEGNDTIVYAGDSLNIHHNTFTCTENYAIMIRGITRYNTKITNNWFYNGLNHYYTPIWYNVLPYPENTNGLIVKNNFYGNASLLPPNTPVLPVSTPLCYNSTINTSQTVNFDCNTEFSSYQWFFGDWRNNLPPNSYDGNNVTGAYKYGTSPVSNHTFTNPGRYNVSLMVRNNHGIPASNYIPIVVQPAQNNDTLSFWVKDSYRGNQTDYFTKEVLIDNTSIWSEDIITDLGWQHICKNISSYIEGKTQITIKLRLKRGTGVSLNNCIAPDLDHIPTIIGHPEYPFCHYVYTFWDDISLFIDGSYKEIKNGDFENVNLNENWDFYQNNTNNPFSSPNSVAMDSRSGNRSLYLNFINYPNFVNAGDYIEASQLIILSSDKKNEDVSIKEVNNNNAYLGNNIPNPFTNSTIIPYQLPDKYTSAEIVVADISGRMIKKYVLNNGTNKIEISNADLPDNGIYFYTLLIDGKNIKTNKMVLMK